MDFTNEFKRSKSFWLFERITVYLDFLQIFKSYLQKISKNDSILYIHSILSVFYHLSLLLSDSVIAYKLHIEAS
jgi:hypothetical protein